MADGDDEFRLYRLYPSHNESMALVEKVSIKMIGQLIAKHDELPIEGGEAIFSQWYWRSAGGGC